jgi:hypothetical protein
VRLADLNDNCNRSRYDPAESDYAIIEEYRRAIGVIEAMAKQD